MATNQTPTQPDTAHEGLRERLLDSAYDSAREPEDRLLFGEAAIALTSERRLRDLLAPQLGDARSALEAERQRSRELVDALRATDKALMDARNGLDLGLGCARGLPDSQDAPTSRAERIEMQDAYLKRAREAHRAVRDTLASLDVAKPEERPLASILPDDHPRSGERDHDGLTDELATRAASLRDAHRANGLVSFTCMAVDEVAGLLERAERALAAEREKRREIADELRDYASACTDRGALALETDFKRNCERWAASLDAGESGGDASNVGDPCPAPKFSPGKLDDALARGVNAIRELQRDGRLGRAVLTNMMCRRIVRAVLQAAGGASAQAASGIPASVDEPKRRDVPPPADHQGDDARPELDYIDANGHRIRVYAEGLIHVTVHKDRLVCCHGDRVTSTVVVTPEIAAGFAPAPPSPDREGLAAKLLKVLRDWEADDMDRNPPCGSGITTVEVESSLIAECVDALAGSPLEQERDEALAEVEWLRQERDEALADRLHAARPLPAEPSEEGRDQLRDVGREALARALVRLAKPDERRALSIETQHAVADALVDTVLDCATRVDALAGNAIVAQPAGETAQTPHTSPPDEPSEEAAQAFMVDYYGVSGDGWVERRANIRDALAAAYAVDRSPGEGDGGPSMDCLVRESALLEDLQRLERQRDEAREALGRVDAQPEREDGEPTEERPEDALRRTAGELIEARAEVERLKASCDRLLESRDRERKIHRRRDQRVERERNNWHTEADRLRKELIALRASKPLSTDVLRGGDPGLLDAAEWAVDPMDDARVVASKILAAAADYLDEEETYSKDVRVDEGPGNAEGPPCHSEPPGARAAALPVASEATTGLISLLEDPPYELLEVIPESAVCDDWPGVCKAIAAWLREHSQDGGGEASVQGERAALTIDPVSGNRYEVDLTLPGGVVVTAVKEDWVEAVMALGPHLDGVLEPASPSTGEEADA